MQPPMTKGDKIAARQERRDLQRAKKLARQAIRREGHVAARLERFPNKLGAEVPPDYDGLARTISRGVE